MAALVIAWDVGQGALLRFFAPGVPERLADGLFLVGVAGSLAIHELVQGLVARAPAWSRRGRTAGDTAEIAAAHAGPITSLGVANQTVMVDRVAYVSGLADPFVRALAAVATFNIVLAGANLAPALPMDGGRLLLAALRSKRRDGRRAAKIAAAATEFTAFAIAAAAVAAAVGGDLSDAVCALLLAVILFVEARTARQSAAGRLAVGTAPLASPEQTTHP